MADINAVISSYDKLTTTLNNVNNITKITMDSISKLNTVFMDVNMQLDTLAGSATAAASGIEKIVNQPIINGLNALGESAANASEEIKKLEDIKVNEKLDALGESATNATRSLRTLASVDVSDKLNAIDKSSKKAFGGKVIQSITKVSKKIGSIKKSASEALGKVGELGKKLFSLDNIEKVKQGMDFVDDFTMTNEKLKVISGGSKVDPGLQSEIFASANNSRSDYKSTVGNVANMKAAAGGAFGSADELIGFTELLQKGVKIGGTSSDQQSTSMSQLTDAMSTGTLGEDAFKSIIGAAPGIAQAISTYTGMSNEELLNMAAKGQLSADLLKNAMFSSSAQINQDFQDMPMTFADIWTKIKNGGLQSISVILEKISELVNSDGFTQFLDGISIGFEYVSEAASWLIDTIINGWDTIGPILALIGGVLLVSIIVQLFSMAMAWIAAFLPVLLFIGLIMMAIAAARSFGVTWEEIAGFVGGLIGGIGAFFYNIFVLVWNIVADFINFFGNAFHDPVSSIKILIYDLVVSVLGFIETMAKGIEDVINKIPGVNVNISGTIKGIKDDFANKSANLKSETEWKEFVKSKDYMDYSDAFKEGENLGVEIFDKINSGLPDPSGGFLGNDYKDFNDLGTSNNPLTVTSDNKSEVNIADEDLKYLRDIAERDYINKLSTATLAPNISVQFGDVHETADADKVAKRVQMIMQEEIAMMSEGVYAGG